MWPWSFATRPNAITPSIVTGRAPDGPDEVAIDAAFADQSGLGVGDVVSLGRPTLRSRIAEELQEAALDPAVGGELPHTPMTTSWSLRLR